MATPDPEAHDAALRFARIDALLDAALELPPEQREAMVRAQCDDDALCREVIDLLRAIESSDGFLEPGADEPPADAEQRIGPWRLLRRLGRGGSGDVWLASRDDGRFEQHVAIKLLRHWAEDEVPRFLREQQLLARLEHPNIARLIDAGSTDGGRPYMVMEYIAGSTLTEHCRARALSVDARLALFAQVCDAVAYAHRHLVVHRDLKPQNILVRDDGRVALLDFGIARLLDGGDARTETRGLRLTPQYAAPEQLAGEAQTTLTDVYALGLVLYELLAGRPPWTLVSGHGSMAALQRALAGPPPAPSTRALASADARRLRGDLDAIVRKALRPEPDARYPSVEALRDDIAQHLALRPVRARGDAFGYRLRRGLRRYWLAATASALVLAGLLGALAAISLAQREATRERDIAQTEARRSKAVRDYLALMFRDAGQHARDGAPLSAKQVLDQAASRVADGFSGDPAAVAELLKALGELHFYIGDYAAAEPLLQRWLTQEDAIGDPVAAADVRFTLAETLHRMGRHDEARTLLARAQAFWATDAERHADVLLVSRMLQSQLERQAGDVAGALQTLERSLPQRLARSGTDDFETAVLYTNLGAAYIQAGRFDEGIVASERAMTLWSALDLDTGNDALNTLNNLAAAYFRTDDLASAEEYFARALAVRRDAYGPSAATAALIGNYARVLQRRGRVADALVLVEEAEPMALQLSGTGSPLTAALRATRAELLLALERHDDCDAVLDALEAMTLPPPLQLRVGIVRARQLDGTGNRTAAHALLARMHTLADTLGEQAAPLRTQLDDAGIAIGYAVPRAAPTPP
ncbi:serine/threonine-protein kinase [Chiayiivirga flava]|uniref:Non-specific serine/threonine protein kinase/serine/threonine-protein kinase n=1 Tax=Chiayiivirga flava TaxID=659595 RepID=A0A7W8FXN3_9GAMM|nr:serine/threonine-protein kinase [Chiayiivirga flava]MBB5206557.1 non-specific serine/threonine protein kinase/serine/threonine-protein kinase [Chiayiivirga flava]